MSDYTPDDIRLAFAESFTLHTMEEPGLTQAYAEFDRFIAKVKADALREWVGLVQSELEATASGGIDLGEKYLHGVYSSLRQAAEYADRIEEEA